MTRKRAKRPTDSTEYLGLMERLTKNFAKRAVGDGIDALHSLALINRMHESVIEELVAYLRSEEGGSASWSEIGEALGITRQSAQGRFGGEGARQPGGQPAHLR
jgi:hypothetical protein